MGWLQQRWVEELDGEKLLRWATQLSQQHQLPKDLAPAGFFGRAARTLVPADLMAMPHMRER
jgi:hypothetical protein